MMAENLFFAFNIAMVPFWLYIVYESFGRLTGLW